jgi:hypothetical protein
VYFFTFASNTVSQHRRPTQALLTLESGQYIFATSDGQEPYLTTA